MLDIANKEAFKILVVGPRNSGKTKLIYQYVYGKYDEHKFTVASDCMTKTVNVFGKNITLNIMEESIGGSESQFGISYRRKLYRDKDIFILTLDMTQEMAIENAITYIDYVHRYFGENMPIVLAGTKSDDTENLKITTHDLLHFASCIKLPCAISSAKSGFNIRHAFEKLIRDHNINKCFDDCWPKIRLLYAGVSDPGSFFYRNKDAIGVITKQIFMQADELDSTSNFNIKKS